MVAWAQQKPEAIVHTYLMKRIAPAAADPLELFFFNSQTIRFQSLDFIFFCQCAPCTLRGRHTKHDVAMQAFFFPSSQ